MRSYRNPFRYRTSEQLTQQGLDRFLRTYGTDVLDLLPEELWDRPLVIRSAPGGGKTSLLRAFTVESIATVLSRPADFEELYRHLSELNAIHEDRSLVLGVRVSLRKDYRDLMDLGVSADVGRRLFFRLLDSHVVRAVCEAALSLAGRRFPDDLESLQIGGGSADGDLIERLGGFGGKELWDRARFVEREIRDLLDSVLPISWEGVTGHGSLYCLRALSGADVVVDGTSLKVRPLIMFDDGQDLSEEQREALLDALTDRDLDLPRWYTERFSALTADEVVGDGEPGRGYVVLPIERATRQLPGQIRRGRKIRPHEAMLLDIADRRARKALFDYGDETENSFTDLLRTEDTRTLDERASEVMPVVRQRVFSLAAGRERYDAWLASASEIDGYEAAIRWRELEIVITRDRDRTQLQLLDLPLTDDDLKALSAASIREAAALFLRQEFRLPYYFGPDRIAKMGSQNVEQFLTLSGNLFEEMLALITLRRRPFLDSFSQDRLVRTTSEAFWKAIPQRRSYGRDMQHLLLRIASIAHSETYREKAPYAPGVTGTALSMRDRARLLDPAVRSRLPGADSLLRALAGAVGHNLLSAEIDRSVKNDRWMVLYLNRLLCARFSLPVGYGGFRERSLEEMCAWMAEPVSYDLASMEPTLFAT